MAAPSPAIAATQSPALTAFTEKVAAVLGENLRSVALFGGAAQGRFEEGSSDLNVAVVIREASLKALDEIAAAAAVARRQIPLELMILEEGDLPDCVDVFATKFYDIRARHVLLSGEDPFAGLVVSPERLIRQARREILNARLRLRQTFLRHTERPDLVRGALERACKTRRVNFAVLTEACQMQAPAEISPPASPTLEQRVDAEGQNLENALRALGSI